MPLVEHLRELRNRMAKGLLAIVAVTIVALVYSEELLQFLAKSVPKCPDGVTSSGGNCAVVTFNTLTAPFSTTIQVSLTVGLVVASPVWLYQLWAFIAPGLHKTEKRYTYAFVGAAVPLFAAGAYLAYQILPVSVKVLISLTPEGAQNLLSLGDVLDFTLRMVLVFGLAFELPLVLVMLNLTGILTGRRMVELVARCDHGRLRLRRRHHPDHRPRRHDRPRRTRHRPVLRGRRVLPPQRPATRARQPRRRARRRRGLAAGPHPAGRRIRRAGRRPRALPEQATGEHGGAGVQRANGYDDIT